MSLSLVASGSMWNVIESLEWKKQAGEQHRYYLKVAKFLKTNCDDEFIKQVREFVSERTAVLRNAIEEAEGRNHTRYWNGGDDSFDDVLHQCVGNGEEFYNEILFNPEQLIDVDYVESFVYCFQ